MTKKVQGTITLDGLVEGRLGEDEAAARLREWVEFVGQLGLRFNLDVNGGQFSMLPDDAPKSTANLGDVPERSIADALEQLVTALPEDVRPHVFSTLRSAEYRPGEEVQSIYGIGVDGKVDVQRRVVDAQTVAPPEPIDLKTKIRMGLSGLVVALAILGIASFFVDFGDLWGQTMETITPMSPDEMNIEMTALEGLIAMEKEVSVTNSRRLKMTIVRGPGFPADRAALEAMIAAETDASKRLAMEALLRGYVRVEMYDKEGKFYHHAELRIADLFRQPKLPALIQLHAKKRTGRVVFTF